MTIAPTIFTTRLSLRPHCVEDFDALAALFATDRSRFMGGPLSRKDIWRWFAAEVGSWPLLGIGSWAIERTADQAYLGQVGLNHPADYPEAELGWTLFEEFEGRGYAQEAARAVLDWTRANRDLPSIVSYINLNNTRSIALAKRLGARPDPDAALPSDDTPEDTAVYRHPERVKA